MITKTKPSNSTEYYVDPLIEDKARLVYVRFDGINPSSTSSPVYFPTDDVLKNKVITGIEVWRVGKTPFSIQTDLGFVGTTLPDTILNSFTLTLVGKNSDILINDFPLNCIVNGSGDFGKTRRFSIMVDLSKSFVRNLSYISLTSTDVIPLIFHYRNP